MDKVLPPSLAAHLEMSEADFSRLRNIFDAQSFVFTCEILPILWGLYPSGYHRLKLLDVGSRTGGGTELLRYLHNPHSFSRIKLDVTALDIDRSYSAYSSAVFPDLKFVYGDIFDPAMDAGYDIVLCSHTIEHVPQPHFFLERLQKMARQWVIVATPFAEQNLIQGHVNRMDYEFFEKTNAVSNHVYRSLTWHQSMACIAVYKGTRDAAV